MATDDLNRLMDNARIRLPGALDDTIKLELFSALDAFFQGSNSWYEDIDFNVVPTTLSYAEDPSQFSYNITPSQAGSIIIRLIGVWDAQGFPQTAFMPTLGTIVLKNGPNEAQTYTARVVLTVSDPVDVDGYPTVPSWVLAKYGNEILDGVLGRMMSQLAKPYTSAQGALYHNRMFGKAVIAAKVETQHQNVYRGQSWSFPQTFNRRRYNKF
jgi:hypothetical protein